MNACAEKCGTRCTCRELNTPPQPDGATIMCPDCIQFEIDRLDAHYDDGRKGFVCANCGMPAWEPQGGQVCEDCAPSSPPAAPHGTKGGNE